MPRRPRLPALAATVLALAIALQPAAAKPRKRAAPPPDDTPELVYGAREDVMRFAQEAAERAGFSADWAKVVLARARFDPTVARLIMPPPAGTAKNWLAYRDRFVEPTRIRAGVAFWSANERWLSLAEQRYGVPPEIVVGIVGVETLYGQHMGDFRVIDALATLAFDFPSGRKDRSRFFREELESYLSLCNREGIEPLAWRGSYAGAIGMPQFMPSSILLHAVDFDHDERIDLHADPADVIGSVARFLFDAGWQPGLATHFEVAVPVATEDRAALLEPDIVPGFNVQEMEARGALLPEAAHSHDGKLALVELQNGDAAPSYVAGTANFYAITRYNRSSYYAMAVIALGETVKAALQRAP